MENVKTAAPSVWASLDDGSKIDLGFIAAIFHSSDSQLKPKRQRSSEKTQNSCLATVQIENKNYEH
jgi:hypothetical protein